MCGVMKKATTRVELTRACRWCGTRIIAADAAGLAVHESACLWNPANRACPSCGRHYVTRYPGRRALIDRCRLLAAHKRVLPAEDCAGWLADPMRRAGA